MAVVSLHALLFYALLRGLGPDQTRLADRVPEIFDVLVERAPPPATPAPPEESTNETARRKDSEGAASPANLRDTPSEIVAPEREIRLDVPPPVIAAPVAGQGFAEAAEQPTCLAREPAVAALATAWAAAPRESERVAEGAAAAQCLHAG